MQKGHQRGGRRQACPPECDNGRPCLLAAVPMGNDAAWARPALRPARLAPSRASPSWPPQLPPHLYATTSSPASSNVVSMIVGPAPPVPAGIEAGAWRPLPVCAR